MEKHDCCKARDEKRRELSEQDRFWNDSTHLEDKPETREDEDVSQWENEGGR